MHFKAEVTERYDGAVLLSSPFVIFLQISMSKDTRILILLNFT